MKPNTLVTLTTDFGLQDAYVGVMKGVIWGIAPQVKLVDLTHSIAPQDLWAARFQLANSVPYFPPGTVHVAVVDPGVGSQRRAIAIQCSQGWLVGPDNGLFSGVLERYPAQKVVNLSDRSYWRERSPSFTFQGRDIFAPVAAHLAQGVALEALGERSRRTNSCN
ncbi:MAG: SAM-dependent chlorinase/fluorinase [Synechococcales cyanobacterium RU_4_20]|nr:SAM-dependent chlorinase/fluorinase [Synechococcales cyanobacterium RU_4_20]